MSGSVIGPHTQSKMLRGRTGQIQLYLYYLILQAIFAQEGSISTILIIIPTFSDSRHTRNAYLFRYGFSVAGATRAVPSEANLL
jgi:hypothetical protein